MVRVNCIVGRYPSRRSAIHTLPATPLVGSVTADSLIGGDRVTSHPWSFLPVSVACHWPPQNWGGYSQPPPRLWTFRDSIGSLCFLDVPKGSPPRFARVCYP